MSQAQLFAIAVVGVLFGPLLAIWPYRMARWSEILDAIGRKPAGRVEPADWQVLLTRVFGIGLSLAGVVAAVLYVL
ncbi:hypothetical protein [Halovenus marina]|uniref:hypothetical protein n=1 Tax=Halovenus marina TaxID=3396621 RepID=UPI003F550126